MLRTIARPILLTLLLTGLGSVGAAEEVTFRIRFGLTDREPTTWNGSVDVSGGRAVGLRSWRPRGADEISPQAWKLATTSGRRFVYRNWEPEPSFPVPTYLNIPGLILTVEADTDARVDLRTAGGNLSFRLSQQPPGRRATYLDGAVVVERAANYISASSDDYQNGFADIAPAPDGGYWVAWIGYRDWSNRVFVRKHDGERFGPIHEVTQGPSDAYFVRLASDASGGVIAIWSDRRNDDFDLYARRFDGESWSEIESLTQAPGPDIHHALATDATGGVWIAWQGFRDGQ